MFFDETSVYDKVRELYKCLLSYRNHSIAHARICFPINRNNFAAFLRDSALVAEDTQISNSSQTETKFEAVIHTR